MKKLLNTLAIAGLLSTPVMAANDHQHEQHQQTKGNAAGMMMGGMDHKQMMKMHEHMKEMIDLMGKIHQETDPEKKEALLEQHMDAMHEGMNMMNEKMHGKAGMGDMATMKMEERMGMMEQRMDMMQQMMGQMTKHQVVEKKSKHSKYRR